MAVIKYEQKRIEKVLDGFKLFTGQVDGHISKMTELLEFLTSDGVHQLDNLDDYMSKLAKMVELEADFSESALFDLQKVKENTREFQSVYNQVEAIGLASADFPQPNAIFEIRLSLKALLMQREVLANDI